MERSVSKALELGVRAAMRDLPGRGRRRSIMEEDKTWVVDLACQKPKDLGYAQELWTTRLLAKHIRKHCGCPPSTQCFRMCLASRRVVHSSCA